MTTEEAKRAVLNGDYVMHEGQLCRVDALVYRRIGIEKFEKEIELYDEAAEQSFCVGIDELPQAIAKTW